MIELNLLPVKEKKSLKKERLYQLIAVSLIVFIVGTAIISLELFWAKTILQENMPSYDISLSKNQELVEKIKNINSQLSAIEKIQNEYIKISPLLISLAQITPPETQIKSFILNQEKKDFYIRGWAKKRDGLLKFQTELEKSEFFTKIEAPLSNLVKQEDIDFEFKGEVKINNL